MASSYEEGKKNRGDEMSSEVRLRRKATKEGQGGGG
jgi:hypothetical protein